MVGKRDQVQSPRSITHFMSISSLFPILVGQKLAQHPCSLTELKIGDLSLGFHFLFLLFNVTPSRMNCERFSWRHDLKDKSKQE